MISAGISLRTSTGSAVPRRSAVRGAGSAPTSVPRLAGRTSPARRFSQRLCGGRPFARQVSRHLASPRYRLLPWVGHRKGLPVPASGRGPTPGPARPPQDRRRQEGVRNASEAHSTRPSRVVVPAQARSPTRILGPSRFDAAVGHGPLRMISSLETTTRSTDTWQGKKRRHDARHRASCHQARSTHDRHHHRPNAKRCAGLVRYVLLQ